jgi:hypothetical protein
MERRSYDVTLTVNGRFITEVVIDPHYEEKHSEMNDALILELVKKWTAKNTSRKSAPTIGNFLCWIG